MALEHRICRPRAKAAGLALVAVLWMVAALALLAAGLAAGTRAEVSVLHAYQTQLRVAAVGDAALHVTANLLRQSDQRPDRLVRETVTFDGVPVEVTVMPGAGLIDLNAGSESLLQALFEIAGGLTAADASALAESVITWRSLERRDIEQTSMISGGVRTRFDVVEDLMQVPGMHFDLFDRIRGLVTTASGADGVNPLAAPQDVLLVLAGGDRQLAATIAQRRDSQDPIIDMTRLDAQHVTPTQSGGYRLTARVPLPDGGFAERSAWLELSPDRRGAPWNLFDFAPVRGSGSARGSE